MSDAKHATVKLYWVFCAVLCGITFMEWAIFRYKDALGITNMVMVPSLIVMSLVKFAMVCGWYMHLRYDNKFLTQMLIAAMAMMTATGVVLGLLMIP